jgi:cytochrome c oxidase cbb3-type subunit 2
MSMRFVTTSGLLALSGLTTSVVIAADGTPADKPAEAAPPAPAPPPPGPPAPLSPPSEAAQRGLVVFARYCASCHGNDGDGRGPSARHFTARATSFRPGIYKCRSTATGALPTDEDLRRSVFDGLPGSGMPSFRALGPLQLGDVIEALKHFSPRFGREPQGPSLAVPPEAPNDQASVARGMQVFDRLKCANCHGWRGEGGPGAAGIHNDDGTPAEATDFSRAQSLRCGDTAEHLYLTVMTGLDGTPMVSFAEVLGGTDAWDLVHYVQSVRR